MSAKDRRAPKAPPSAVLPRLLPPVAGNADPTPLIATLARVAVAIAQRQAAQADPTTTAQQTDGD